MRININLNYHLSYQLCTILGISESIISFTETWLNDKNSENVNLSNFDFICSNRENRKGGGVGFFYFK